tara:strand:+ start:68 stop:676 length:609 start_codon:yes stop_codon:yes gene_type:complete
MLINPKKFKKVILVGWDYDLVHELNKNKIRIIGYTSNSKKNEKFDYLGSIKNLKKLNTNVGLLLTDSDIKLKKLVYKKYKKQICTFISKKAIVPNLKNLGLGAIIQSNVFLSDNSKIGLCVKVNVGSQIHHDSTVGDFSILGPKVVILGNNEIGKECFIGSGSIIKNKLKIANNSFIGMGSVVTKNTLKNKKYFGNPARIFD